MVKLAKRRGNLETLDGGRETFIEFEKEWWANYVDRHLATTTRKTYRFLVDKCVLPELGNQQLRRITPRTVSAFAAQLPSRPATARKVLAILQGIMERAVEWETHSDEPAPSRTQTSKEPPADH